MFFSGRFLSATDANCVDQESLNYYRNLSDGEWGDVLAYEDTISECDIGRPFISSNGDFVTKECLGEKVLIIVDGHHRATVASEMGIGLRYEEFKILI